eukprot:CAMPEP_0119130132 /NCGR_PEP_ID=MMETSP1310-20130426/7590_1 /TAXON_ID=464262 /ORGANISM="Genus nov. species nov., Strain RCC2339" /LENGTH=547 /DNA_ID=CAMNT_0007120609 /DNA_START=21 /DNA_END=1661 /DNA_ORIENTATION=+
MKGLRDAIGVSVVHPTWKATRPGRDGHMGWAFSEGDTFDSGRGVFPTPGCVPDPHYGCATVRDLYDLASGQEYSGRYTVPVLWDLKTKAIVNNESSEIIRMLNSSFDAFAANPSLDLCPAALRGEIEELQSWIYPGINNGVYRCGFATSQAAYDQAVGELYKALDRVEEILSRRRYLCGSQITEVDIWLFMTLIRFDEVYVVYFKCNKRAIHEYPNTFEYVKDLYQTPGIGDSVDMWHIKTHYFTSHPQLNATASSPRAPASTTPPPTTGAGSIDGARQASLQARALGPMGCVGCEPPGLREPFSDVHQGRPSALPKLHQLPPRPGLPWRAPAPSSCKRERQGGRAGPRRPLLPPRHDLLRVHFVLDHRLVPPVGLLAVLHLPVVHGAAEAVHHAALDLPHWQRPQGAAVPCLPGPQGGVVRQDPAVARGEGEGRVLGVVALHGVALHGRHAPHQRAPPGPLEDHHIPCVHAVAQLPQRGPGALPVALGQQLAHHQQVALPLERGRHRRPVQPQRGDHRAVHLLQRAPHELPLRGLRRQALPRQRLA